MSNSALHCATRGRGTAIKTLLFKLCNVYTFKTEAASIVLPIPTSSANITLQFFSCKQRIIVLSWCSFKNILHPANSLNPNTELSRTFTVLLTTFLPKYHAGF